ncbi:MAG: response regulator [Thermoanaerobaculaceae bacterium]|nr:response regulator [Thermoanaerobaculaceae bacterium]
MAHLLLVEDNEASRDMLGRRLRRRGFDVSLAADGAEGLAQARALGPDLVLLDLSLPVLDGWTVARILKSDAATSSIPVVALTAHAMAGDRERALAAGCDDFATKPVDFEALLAAIGALLRGGRARV